MHLRLSRHTSLLCLALALTAGCAQPNQYQPPPPRSVSVAKPIQQSVTNFLEETGSTEPVEMVAIRARVKGYLEEIKFEAGADVEAGDVLYVIQKREYEAKVSSAKADVQAMQVALNLAELEYKRQQNLVADNATAQTKVDQAEAARDGAIASLESAKAALDQAQLDLEYTEVKTPISGRVGKTLVKLGNLVGEAEATHLTTVISYDPIYVNFSINERALLAASRRSDREDSERPDITTINAYMRRALDDGYPFEGQLEYADLAVDQSTGTFMIRAIFPNPNMQILPGLFVRVRVPLGTTDDALLIPERAIGADQAGRFVLIVGDDNIVERRPIVKGAKYDNMVVVTEGLSGAERVVIDGLQRSRPGAKVTPTEKELSPVNAQLESVESTSEPPAPEDATEPEANENSAADVQTENTAEPDKAE